MRPPKVAYIAPREASRTRNDAVSRGSGSLVTRLTSRGAMKATFGGHVKDELRPREVARAERNVFGESRKRDHFMKKSVGPRNV